LDLQQCRLLPHFAVEEGDRGIIGDSLRQLLQS
jgi:hypothetical protein